MDGTRALFVQDVVHEGFSAVNEQGTEAAAATAVLVGRTSVPQPATFRADRPFVFAIRDRSSGALPRHLLGRALRVGARWSTSWAMGLGPRSRE
jgi:serine protease inhibitor